MIDDEKRDGEKTLTKVERLEAAAIVAPVVRANAAKMKRRPVKVVDKDGKVIRHATLADVQEGLLAAKKIEIEVDEGVRPKESICHRCGALMKVKDVGFPPKTCRPCSRKSVSYKNVRCADCAREAAVRASRLKRVLDAGRPYRCMDCAHVLTGIQARERTEAMSQEDRKKLIAPARAAMEARRANAAKKKSASGEEKR